MLTLIPFVPANNDTIPADLYQVARDAWCSQLTALLDDTSDNDFLHAIQENTSLHDFVLAVLNAQMDGHSVDREVSKRVFFIFYRAGQLKAKGGPLLTIDRLSSFAVSYQESNPDQVRTIFTAFLQADPRLEEAVRSSFAALLSCLSTLQSTDINKDHDQRIYVIVRLLEALTSACIDTAPHEGIIDALFRCYPALRRKDDSGPTLYLIKRALVNILNYVVDCLYFDPIRYAKDSNVIDEFSRQLLGWIEKSNLDTTYRAFIDGPLVMDWQVECSVSNTLGDINREYFNGYPFSYAFIDEDRIEFLQLSMEQVRDMNTATETWKDKLQKQRERKLPSSASSISAQPSVEQVAKISQIQDLFPDLGQGFIQACLLEYNDDVETVIMQLLEDNLPPKLAEMDRSLADLSIEAVDPSDTAKKSILESRRNIFDNDEFDLLSGNAKVDINKMHIGKKSRGTTESLLDDKSFIQEEKANVIQRVYDMYDDEYDDTYDGINEAPGTVGMDDEDDSAVDKVKGSKKKQPTAEDPGVAFESTLIHTYVDNRDVFNRSSAVRRSKARAELRKITGMSDEQLEGWAIMLDRSPRRQRILDKYMLFDGQQEKVDGKSLKEAQHKQVQEKRVAAQDETKQRAYKDKNKARFGNHNRKRGHDKKMQKAGVMGNS